MTARGDRVYLDHNATAPLLPEAREALLDALGLCGNPSSVHEEGRKARATVEAARRKVAALVGASAEALVFTSGATEAANTCLAPHWLRHGEALTLSCLAVADTDHAATRDGGRFAAADVTRLAVDAAGRLRLDALDAWIAGIAPDRTAMLALSLANSETGVIQDIAAVTARLAGTSIFLVLDVVQAAGRLPLDIAALGADALILSGHKIGAAKGVGAYALAEASVRPRPMMAGGGQENGRRAGTEAVPAIASFGAAAEVAAERLAADGGRLRALREHLVARLCAADAMCAIVGADAERLPNTVAVAARGLRAETAQIALDLAGIAVSSGSACASGKVGPSHVLAAMHAGGLGIDLTAGAIRISFGYETTQDEIDRAADALLHLLARGRSVQGTGGGSDASGGSTAGGDRQAA